LGSVGVEALWKPLETPPVSAPFFSFFSLMLRVLARRGIRGLELDKFS
jgi:hypothetical protein